MQATAKHYPRTFFRKYATHETAIAGVPVSAVKDAYAKAAWGC